MTRTTKVERTYTIEAEDGNYAVTVEITGSYDPGVWSYRNGDPGYPPHEDVDYRVLSVVFVDEDDIEVGVLPDSVPNEVYTELDRLVNDEELDYYD